MTNEEYMHAQHIICLARGLLEQLDLGAFLARIDKAEATGPIFDPTLYREAGAKLGAIRRLGEAAAQFKGVPLP